MLFEFFRIAVISVLLFQLIVAILVASDISTIYRFESGRKAGVKRFWSWVEAIFVAEMKVVFWSLFFPPLHCVRMLGYRLHQWRPEIPWVFRVAWSIGRVDTMMLADLLQFEEEISETAGETMIIKRAGNKPVHYTPVADRGEDVPADQKAVVVMEPLSRIKVSERRDRMITFKGGTVSGMKSSSVTVRNVLDQISGWKNIYIDDGNGAPVELVWDPAKKVESYDQLPLDFKAELEAVFGEGGYSELNDVAFERNYHRSMSGDNDEDEEEGDDTFFEGLND